MTQNAGSGDAILHVFMSLLRRIGNLPLAAPHASAVAGADHAPPLPVQTGFRPRPVRRVASYFSEIVSVWRPASSHSTREAVIAFIAAAVATLIFYLRSLVAGSQDAGVVYTGDFWHVWLPLVAQVNSLVQRGVFSGIEFATHGGAAEFFIRPGLYAYHPILLLYSFFSHSGAVDRLIRFSVLLLALHSFLACYFAIRVAFRYLKMGMGAAIFVGLGYAFSWQMVTAMEFPPFLLATTLLPWSIYAALAVNDRPSLRKVLQCSLPAFMMLLGGYSVIAFTCLVLAWGFVAAYLLYIQGSGSTLRDRFTRLAWATAPFVVAGVVVLPLFWAMLKYFPLGRGPAAVTIFHSAYEVAEKPRTILRLLSPHLVVPGPMLEFTLVWGTIAVVIAILFFAGLRDTEELSASDWSLFKVCASVYALLVLAIYGVSSAVSDLLYYLPGIGMMHSYQRHLVAIQFFFMIAMGIMLQAITRRAPNLAVKMTLFALAGLLAFSAYGVANDSALAKDLHLNDYIVLELLFGLLFTASLLVPGKWFAALAATFLTFLTPLRYMYDFSTGPGNARVYDVQRTQQLNLDSENNARVVSYFRTHSRKPIVKYLDLQPGVINYFPRNYPWFLAMDLQLSTYGGYEFLQAPRASYAQRMPFVPLEGNADYWIMRPDWNWVAQTEAEFVIYQDGFRLNDPHLPEMADLRDPANVLRLPNNIVIAPLRAVLLSTHFPSSLKGRFVRVQLAGTNHLSLAEVRVLGSGGNLAAGKAATQSSDFSPAARASNAVDGSTNGDFAAGSVTATNLEPHAWWQVDLGSSRKIDAVEVWNRTDGAQDRLNDYWIFVSDAPFGPSDTPAMLQARSATVGHQETTAPSPSTIIRAAGSEPKDTAQASALFDNGYLRVVGPPGAAVGRQFRTDGATNLSLDVDASQPVKVQYLFWPNDRLKFSLQNRPVEAPLEDGLQTVTVPPGRQHLEIRYVYWPTRLFLILYVLYALSFLVAVFMPVTRKRVFA
jgi:F5/8 type C domain